jgi:hypothetical protein
MGKMKRILSWLITGFGEIAIVFISYYNVRNSFKEMKGGGRR